MHDESLRYVLPDQAIAAIAVSLPKGPTEVFSVLAETDLNISSIYPSSSPSPIVVAHVEELCHLLENTTTNMDAIFKSLLEKYKDPSGLCRLSVYNYNLITQLKFSCKSPVYHNCRIYASDGRLLCYCDRKKLEWFVS
jgi:cation-transporting P-type ATPase D